VAAALEANDDWTYSARAACPYRAATSPVVFGEAEDVYLLGAVTLETLGFVLDPFRRELRPLRMPRMAFGSTAVPRPE
jgi:hypothetical protein